MSELATSGTIPPLSFPAIEKTPGLFFTSLVQQQTKGDGRKRSERSSAWERQEQRRIDRLAAFYEHYIPPATATETHVRHGRWLPARAAVRAALRASGTPGARIDRFDKCGSDCVVEVSSDGNMTRLRAHYCGDRFCRPCCAARARKVVAQIVRCAEGETLRFLTLTRQADDTTLVKALNQLLKSFAKLRDTALWKSAVTAGVYFVEITRNFDTRRWHVHVHVLVSGSYIPQNRLSEQWRQSSGGSFVVDIRAVASNERAAAYVAKYASKGFADSILADPDSLIEAVLAVRSRRLLSFIGSWRGRVQDDVKEEQVKWRSIGRLDDIVDAAVRREQWALAALHALRLTSVLDALPCSLREVPRSRPP